ncbi:MAG: peptide chain release factor N(5)-glutamine methyltransferase [Oscillospiraceae bacterium]|nr:peptide chain release factor N(5)-glutamine methyltransferase [Oscillospiraceae bacterium]
MVRKLKDFYIAIKQELTKAGIESPAFDALCIFEHVLGFKGRAYLSIKGEESISEASAAKIAHMAEQRKSLPLQYVLGSWSFMDMELELGEGVLIPREDTEVLVRLAGEFIGSAELRVLDLCAGTGAVALGVARLCPKAQLTAVELSPAAFEYLERNIKRHCPERVSALAGDVLAPPQIEGGLDVILSNPPYIPSADIASLQWEVKKEPELALNGGTDGLDFYRAITTLWLPLLNKGGLLAFEVGIGQSEQVAELLKAAGLSCVEGRKDLNGIVRCCCGCR